jgi:cytoskeletal protein RodZ
MIHKIQTFLKSLEKRSQQDKHEFSVFVSSILTLFVIILLLFSWYLDFYDLPIENTLLTKIVSLFE